LSSFKNKTRRQVFVACCQPNFGIVLILNLFDEGFANEKIPDIQLVMAFKQASITFTLLIYMSLPGGHLVHSPPHSDPASALLHTK
jgi:hypothetical protein